MNKSAEDCFHLGVKLLLCDSEGKVLLLKKRKGAYWELPGGRQQRGESLLETLQREVEEETGWKDLAGAWPCDMFLTQVRIPTQKDDVGLILSVYRCDIPVAIALQLSEEHSDFGWFPFSQAAQLLSDQHYPQTFIEKILFKK